MVRFKRSVRIGLCAGVVVPLAPGDFKNTLIHFRLNDRRWRSDDGDEADSVGIQIHGCYQDRYCASKTSCIHTFYCCLLLILMMMRSCGCDNTANDDDYFYCIFV